MHHRSHPRPMPTAPRMNGHVSTRERVLAWAFLAIAAIALLPGAARANLASPDSAVSDPTILAATPNQATPLAAPSRPVPAIGSHAGSTAKVAPPVEPPHDLRHVNDWTAYRAARHIASLPVEARLFYRHGLIAKQAGQDEEALVDVRGAAELDPAFVEPHLTMAAWLLTREPGQALQHYAIVLEQLRANFRLQLELAANAFLIGTEGLFMGLLLAGLLLVWLKRYKLTHVWRESLARFGTRRGARWWAIALLGLPYVAGFGVTLPTVGFLAYLWPNLNGRERTLFILLLAAVVSMPFAIGVAERFALPLHEESAPFYAVPAMENAPYAPERETRLANLAARQPGSPLLEFGLAWTARRGNHLAEAEAAYRRVLEAWPQNDRAWNNLGNVLAMQGRGADALQCYQRAQQANPADAAAWFNASQIHTQRFDYQAATDALSKASALNFELVRTYQASATADGLLPLIDQWLEPKIFWDALRTAPLPREAAGSLPLALRSKLETSGWIFSVVALLVAALGIGFGLVQHRRLHLRVCSNCGDTVCRRCAQRRRENALCPGCAAAEAQGETPEFARVLLQRRRQQKLKQQGLVNTAFASLIPGYGLLAHRRVFTPIVLLAATWLLARGWAGAAVPFALEPRLTLPGQEIPVIVIVCGLAFVYGVSLLGYFGLAERERSREASLNAAQRGRIAQSTRRSFQTAA